MLYLVAKFSLGIEILACLRKNNILVSYFCVIGKYVIVVARCWIHLFCIKSFKITLLTVGGLLNIDFRKSSYAIYVD